MVYISAAVLFVVPCLVFTASSLTSMSTMITHLERCLISVQNLCDRHSGDSAILCLSDGSKHTGRCAYYKYHCSHMHTHVTGFTEACTMPTRAPPITRPLPGHFELTLYDAITHGIDDRLQSSKTRGVAPSDAINIFTKQDHTHGLYVRNRNCWAYGLDLTSISPWNSNLRNKKAGTLISPRHAVLARHYNIKINSTIRFVDVNNNVVERRIVTSKAVSSGKSLHGSFGQDIVVGLLDSDVPSSISFAKVMPKNLTKFRVPYTMHIPTMSTDQEEKALVDDFSYYANLNIGLRVPQTNTIRRQFYESKIGGDSGNPTFFVIDGELVLLFVFTTGGAGGGTSINHYFDQINQIMAQLGGAYQLTEADLSRFLEHGKPMPNVIGK